MLKDQLELFSEGVTVKHVCFVKFKLIFSIWVQSCKPTLNLGSCELTRWDSMSKKIGSEDLQNVSSLLKRTFWWIKCKWVRKHTDFISLAICVGLKINGKMFLAQHFLNFICLFSLIISGRWKLRNDGQRNQRQLWVLHVYITHDT